ncbi:MAG TPA: nitronate monooxygenase [Candidatus Dormibacteraeota bacterium]|jgi:NAD(P)H-dependent flavin oxidoreductase YrpB (nitropropane dioxygenase family)|nr:nitronate monooxygenase [Candidatus Dormibacteraeota bacterium]
MKTRFTDLVGCELPIQLAAMGGVGTSALSAAVVAAGGLGMVPSSVEPASGASGLNYLVPFAPPPDAIQEAAKSVRVVEFFYGDPAANLVWAAHAGGALAGWQVGSVAEAVAAADAGCDFIVAQGIEAGGHVRGNQQLDELLRLSINAVHVPVVAAGGIATAERVRELLLAGAAGVRVGTRFIATPESGAHPDYVNNLLTATGADTTLTEWFGEGWEHAPHRVLRSAEAAARESGWRATVPPYRGIDRTARDMAMYAGTGVGEVRSVQPAAEVVANLVALL